MWLLNTTTIIEEVVPNQKGPNENCLEHNDIDVHAVTGFENLLYMKNSGIKVFEKLDTDEKRISYYKENFGLQVSTSLFKHVSCKKS